MKKVVLKNFSVFTETLQTSAHVFWMKFAHEEYFPVKKRKSEHYHLILPIRISLFDNCLFDMTFWVKFSQKGYFWSKNESVLIFWTKIAQKRYSSPKRKKWARKSKHHHWILDIRISLGTKFQLKLAVLNFWTKFAQKGCFFKQKMWTLP